MASKFIALFVLVAAASAQHYQNDYYQQQYQPQYHSAPAVIKQVQPAIIKSIQPATLIKKVEYAEAPAEYEFQYDVHDDHTGDIKQQHEKASAGAVVGQYSLIDADGYRRIVDYTADDHHGFQATVRREPLEGHKIVKAVQPAYIAQPATKYIAQPALAVQKLYTAPAQVVQKYVAPAQQYYQQAPVVHKYEAPAQQYYQSAPVVQKYVAPVVTKYVAPAQQYYQQAPVVHKYEAPAHQYYQSAPVVQKYVAPVVQKIAVASPVKYTSAENSAHVSFNAPTNNYHY